MFSWLLGKTGLYLLLLAIIAVAVAVIARNWSCRQKDDPPIKRYGPYEVAKVDSGAALTVKFGVRDRRHREVELAGILAPAADDPLFATSRDHLASLAGKEVSIECHKEHLLRRPDVYSGPTFNAAGQELQIEQLRAGLATCDTGASKAYKAAEDEAKKAKRGLWAKRKRKASDDWKEVDCEDCNGTGKLDGIPCPYCCGKGEGELNGKTVRCPVCEGAGECKGTCSMCGGTGKMYEETEQPPIPKGDKS